MIAHVRRDADDGLTARSWVTLITFVVANPRSVLCINRAVRIPLPHAVRRTLLRVGESLRLVDPPIDGERKSTRWHITLSLVTAPVIAVALLWASTCIDASVIRLGIVGDEGVRPYDVLVLFISLAYISTSLDATGGLRSLAFLVSQRAGNSGPVLYTVLYSFFFLSGCIIGNDPIVLSGTAFLVYFCKTVGIVPPTAWTFAEFISANIVLVSSNPTNVLIAGAFDLNFLTGFTKYTILPSVVCGVVGYVILFAQFTLNHPPPKTERDGESDDPHRRARYIPKSILTPDVDPRAALIDPPGAIFHTALLLITLGTLVGTSFVSGVEVWMITAPAGIIALLRDFGADWLRSGAGGGKQASEGHGNGDADRDMATPTTESVIEKPSEAPAQKPIDETMPLPNNTSSDTYPPTRVGSTDRKSLPSLWRAFSRRFPTLSTTLVRLPIPLLPFAFAMFILVRALEYNGWIAVFATWAAKVCTTPAHAAFFIGPLTSLVLCSILGTNIGATIALVEILRHPNFAQSAQVLADPMILKSAIFNVAMGSNLGAFSGTFSASLAGLLWQSILRQKGVIVKPSQFFIWNLVPIVVLSLVSAGVVLGEISAF